MVAVWHEDVMFGDMVFNYGDIFFKELSEFGVEKIDFSEYSLEQVGKNLRRHEISPHLIFVIKVTRPFWVRQSNPTFRTSRSDNV